MAVSPKTLSYPSMKTEFRLGKKFGISKSYPVRRFPGLFICSYWPPGNSIDELNDYFGNPWFSMLGYQFSEKRIFIER